MNTKKIVKPGMILVSLALCIFALNFSTAVSAESKKGNQAKGKYYFRQTCKSCHSKGQSGGEVTPMTKTMAQWKRYFEEAKHNKRTETLSKVMPEEQLRDVSAYVVDHAADSLQPETCGK
jgi:mono/diheme cytochrome c family protein